MKFLVLDLKTTYKLFTNVVSLAVLQITILVFLLLFSCENQPTETNQPAKIATEEPIETLDLTKYPSITNRDIYEYEYGYDSSSNLSCYNYLLYIGQHLVIHRPTYDFYLEQGNDFYKDQNAESIKYLKEEDILDVEFKVLDVVFNRASSMLKLLNTKTEEIIYFMIEPIDPDLPTRSLISEHKMHFPFIVVGFYEKMQKVLAGQSFAFSKEYYILKDKDIISDFGDEWKFVELKISENDYYYLDIILKNKHNQKISLPYKQVFPSYGIPYFFTYRDFKKYREKFNDSDLEVILSHEVKKGFTKEMVVLSIGEPDKIKNNSDGSSLWIYQEQKNFFVIFDGILTFDKEILTDIYKERKWNQIIQY